MRKLGLIAGGGDLPVEIARSCAETGRPLHVIRLRGMADPSLGDLPGDDVGIAQLGLCIRSLKTAGCSVVCFAGNVARPDFASLKPDARGLMALPGLIAAGRRGDDSLLRALLGEFEREGFEIEGAEAAAGRLRLPAGPLGKVTPPAAIMPDIERALTVAREIGRLDIGQGAVVCEGLVLAVEAQEGTDQMLARVAQLPRAVRGEPGVPRGVLAKAPKPIQEVRVDLPTIGLATIERVWQAGLAGIAGEAGRLLVLERDAVIARADALGLFIIGLEAPE